MMKGFTVHIRFAPTSAYYKAGVEEATLEGITEIHYNYREGIGTPSWHEPRVAFETGDPTGTTYKIEDIEEFEAKL